MKKTIILSDLGKVEMTFEEVREQFEGMIYREIHKVNDRLSYNKFEIEDFKQELEIELWRAFELYDVSKGICFSTFLTYRLKKGVRDVTYTTYSLKNKNNGISSLDTSLTDDGLTLMDLLENESVQADIEGNILNEELLELIRLHLKEDDYDTFRCMINRIEYPISQFAEDYNLTRQGANQRVKRLQRKLIPIIEEQYLCV